MALPNETSLEEIREAFRYDTDRGVLLWNGRKGRPDGAHAGAPDKDGYLVTRLKGRRYPVHRIVFALVHGRWPQGDIDHVNRVRDDNRVENLRECTRTQNNGNCGARKHNKSGYKGVYFSQGKWRAMIRFNKKGHHIGCYASAVEASAAYETRAKEVFGEFYSVGG